MYQNVRAKNQAQNNVDQLVFIHWVLMLIIWENQVLLKKYYLWQKKMCVSENNILYSK